jgi:hypothetical protein
MRLIVVISASALGIALTGCSGMSPNQPSTPSGNPAPSSHQSSTASVSSTPAAGLILYDPDGSSLDIRVTSKLVRSKSGCLGLERPDGKILLAAFPRGTTFQNDIVQVKGMEPVAIGSQMTYTGSSRTIEAAIENGVQIPENCRGDTREEIWLVLPIRP